MQLLISISPGPVLAFTHRNNTTQRRASVHSCWHSSKLHSASAHFTNLSVSQSARSCWTFKSLKTKGVLLFHLIVLCNSPSETLFLLCTSILFYFIFLKLHSFPFYLHTEDTQNGTCARSHFSATTTKQMKEKH